MTKRASRDPLLLHALREIETRTDISGEIFFLKEKNPSAAWISFFKKMTQSQRVKNLHKKKIIKKIGSVVQRLWLF